MIRRTIAFAVLMTVAVACGGEPRFTADQLPGLVLQPFEAPAGTSLDQASSGTKTLDEFAKDDKVKRAELADAGFVTSYFRLFLAPELFDGKDASELSPAGSLATAFALLFKTPDGAEQGLGIVERAVRRDGRNLRERPSAGLGDASFSLEGTLEPGLPPGYLYAWKLGNAVFGIVAAGAPGAISENSARDLADQMAARAR
ncbi:MAG: hypothetical protein WDA27_04305 [Actinomycetota bacterium]